MENSARVRLELVCAGQTFPLAQVGDDLMIFPEPVVLPSHYGEVRIYIDDKLQTCQIAWARSAELRRIFTTKNINQK